MIYIHALFVFLLCTQVRALTLTEAFQALELSPPATLDQARAARNRLAKKYHTDQSGADTLEKMKEVNAAYDLLKQFHAGTYFPESSGSQHTRSEDFTSDFGASKRSAGAQANDSVYPPLEEVLYRKGRYERFLSDYASQVLPGLEREFGFPVRASAEGPLALRWSVFRGTPWFANLALDGVFALPMLTVDNPYVPSPVLALIVSLALKESMYYTVLGKMHDRGTAFVKVLDQFVKSFGIPTADRNKQYLLYYDLAEVIASSNITRSQLKKWNYYPQFIRVLKLFPDALPGFLLRAQAGVGLAGQLKDQLVADLMARPKFWTDQFRVINIIQLPPEIRDGDLMTQLRKMNVERLSPSWSAKLKIKKLQACEVFFKKAGQFAP